MDMHTLTLYTELKLGWIQWWKQLSAWCHWAAIESSWETWRGGRAEMGKRGKSLCKSTDITQITHTQHHNHPLPFSYSLVTMVTKTRLQPSLFSTPRQATFLHSSSESKLYLQVLLSNYSYTHIFEKFCVNRVLSMNLHLGSTFTLFNRLLSKCLNLILTFSPICSPLKPFQPKCLSIYLILRFWSCIHLSPKHDRLTLYIHISFWSLICHKSTHKKLVSQNFYIVFPWLLGSTLVFILILSLPLFNISSVLIFIVVFLLIICLLLVVSSSVVFITVNSVETFSCNSAL